MGHFSFVVLLVCILVVACLVFVLKTQFNNRENFVELNDNTRKHIRNSKGMEKCDFLFVETPDMPKDDYLTMSHFVNGLRLRKWKPNKDDEFYPQMKEDKEYCYMYNDELNDTQDIALNTDKSGFDPCTKDNPMFDTPLVTNVFNSDFRDRAHNVPIRKCVFELDKNLLKDEKLVAEFWNKWNRQDCLSLERGLRQRLSDSTEKKNALIRTQKLNQDDFIGKSNDLGIVRHDLFNCRLKKKEIEVELKKTQSSLEEYKALYKKEAESLANIKVKIQELVQKIEELEKKEEELKSRYESLKADYELCHNNELPECQRRKEAIERENAFIQEQLNELRAEVERLKQELTLRLDLLRRKKEDVRVCESELAYLTNKYNELKPEYERIKGELDACETEKEQLKKDYENYKETYETFSNVYYECENERGILNERKGVCQNKVEKCVNDVHNMVQNINFEFEPTSVNSINAEFDPAQVLQNGLHEFRRPKAFFLKHKRDARVILVGGGANGSRNSGGLGGEVIEWEGDFNPGEYGIDIAPAGSGNPTILTYNGSEILRARGGVNEGDGKIIKIADKEYHLGGQGGRDHFHGTPGRLGGGGGGPTQHHRWRVGGSGGSGGPDGYGGGGGAGESRGGSGGDGGLGKGQDGNGRNDNPIRKGGDGGGPLEKYGAGKGGDGQSRGGAGGGGGGGANTGGGGGSAGHKGGNAGQGGSGFGVIQLGGEDPRSTSYFSVNWSETEPYFKNFEQTVDLLNRRTTENSAQLDVCRIDNKSILEDIGELRQRGTDLRQRIEKLEAQKREDLGRSYGGITQDQTEANKELRASLMNLNENNIRDKIDRGCKTDKKDLETELVAVTQEQEQLESRLKQVTEAQDRTCAASCDISVEQCLIHKGHAEICGEINIAKPEIDEEEPVSATFDIYDQTNQKIQTIHFTKPNDSESVSITGASEIKFVEFTNNNPKSGAKFAISGVTGRGSRDLCPSERQTENPYIMLNIEPNTIYRKVHMYRGMTCVHMYSSEQRNFG